MISAKVIFETQTGPFIRLLPPAPAVAALVDYYIFIEVPPARTVDFQIIALPSLQALLSVPLAAFRKSVYDHFGDRHDVIDQAMLLGSLRTAVTCAYPPGAREFSVKFKPGVMPLLFDLEPARLSGSNLKAEDNVPQDLIAALTSQENFRDLASVMDNWLAEKAASILANQKLTVVTKALQPAKAAPGRRLSDLAESGAVSTATLNRYCREIFDLSAARCFSLLRFRDALERYRAAGSTMLFDELGYADFSHFAKESKKLTRTRPSAL